MAADDGKNPFSFQLSTIDGVLRLGLIALIGYWSVKVVGPFLTIALWSAILTVALYPLFEWLAPRLGSRRLAAALVTLLCLMIVLGPVTWLGFALIGGAEYMVREFDAHAAVVIPSPPESVKDWPLVGEQAYRLWTLAATDTKAILIEVAPKLKPLGGKVLDLAGIVLYGLLEFIVSIIIAGFLYVPGRRLLAAIRPALSRIWGSRAEEMLKLAGSTIRNVSRGVVGIALLQALLAGVGFLAVGIHGAGFLSFVALILGIIQIGPSILIIPIVVWSWTAMDTTTALIFTAYMIPVGLVDNVLRPVLVARGLTTPMPVILVGVLGGTIAYGISGLFLGPIILSVAWALAAAWVQDDGVGPDASYPRTPEGGAPEGA